jgi:hypothetical protein
MVVALLPPIGLPLGSPALSTGAVPGFHRHCGASWVCRPPLQGHHVPPPLLASRPATPSPVVNLDLSDLVATSSGPGHPPRRLPLLHPWSSTSSWWSPPLRSATGGLERSQPTVASKKSVARHPRGWPPPPPKPVIVVPPSTAPLSPPSRGTASRRRRFGCTLPSMSFLVLMRRSSLGRYWLRNFRFASSFSTKCSVCRIL